MSAQYVRGFMTLRLATLIAVSLLEQHLRIFQKIGYVRFVELAKRSSLLSKNQKSPSKNCSAIFFILI